MPSLSKASGKADVDEAILFASGGLALAVALLAAGWGSGSPRVGLVGAAFASLGVWASWRLRTCDLRRRLLLGALGGVLAASSLQALISWEIGTEVGRLYMARADVGLSLALRMSLLLITLTFLLVSRNVVAFALVPGLALFGLAGARGQAAVAFVSFAVFLPAALIAVSQAMMLSGESVRSRDDQTPSRASRWRARHWLLVGGLIAAVLVAGAILYVPAYAYGTQYYWQLALMSIDPPSFGRFARPSAPQEVSRSYAVGTGPVAPTERLALSFDRDPGPLWRGEVFDVYTGTSWRSSDAKPRPLPPTDDVLKVARSDVPRSHATTYTVRVESALPLILFSPGRIYEAELPPSAGRSLRGGIYVDQFGCVFAPEAGWSPGARYRLSADPTSFGDSMTSAGVELSPVEELDSTYLAIPLSTRRVADLARRVAGNAVTPEQKLSALSAYLNEHAAYTLAAPAAPTGEDALEYFIFRSKRGYCDLFATALAIMGRAVGVPTRFVTGFAGTQYDPETERYIFRESDAHAWVEAYVPSRGWIAVEATPGGGPSPIPPLQRALLSLRFAVQDHPVLVGLLLAAVVLGTTLLVGLLRRAHRLQQRRFGDKHDPRAMVVRAYEQLTRSLARRGCPRRLAQTPLEYLGALERNTAWISRRPTPIPPAALAPARSLTEAFLRARYGPDLVPQADAELALQRLREIQLALRGRTSPS